jgi:hypothetical protein
LGEQQKLNKFAGKSKEWIIYYTTLCRKPADDIEIKAEGIFMLWLAENEWWIKLLVEIGILGALTWLVYMNKYYYKQSLGAKNDRIAILEATQVDNYLSKMESEKNYRNQIIREYEKKIEELVADINVKELLVTELKTMLHNLDTLAASGWSYTYPWEGEYLKKKLGEDGLGRKKLGA